MGRCLQVLATTLLSGAMLLAGGPDPDRSTEFQLKASTIGLLADYVTWPKDNASAPLVIGVFGACPLGKSLQESLDARLIQGRKVQIITLKNLYGLDRCDILFICGTETEQLHEILKQLRGKPVLTICDVAGMGEAGVMVNLVLEKGRLNFEVNLPAIRRGGLSLSSRVLKLARIIGS